MNADSPQVAMPHVVSPHRIAAALTEDWSPRVIAEIDDCYVKVAKVLEECLIMLIERKSTRHTGNIVTDKTRSIDEQLRPV